tara:strand:+ start:59 stop:217 length:159 start_codon:yes stop_codon:yes gene_type:complete
LKVNKFIIYKLKLTTTATATAAITNTIFITAITRVFIKFIHINLLTDFANNY